MTSPLNEHTTGEIRAELARQRKRQKALALVLTISEAQVSERLAGNVVLNLRELELIAEFLGKPISHFLPAWAVDRETVSAA